MPAFLPFLLPFALIAVGGAFEHEQGQLAAEFKGQDQGLRSALWFSAYAGWATRIALLVYIGFKLSWIAAIAMFLGAMVLSGVVAGTLSALAGRYAGAMGRLYVSLAAFVVWPLCFLAAFFTLPGAS